MKSTIKFRSIISLILFISLHTAAFPQSDRKLPQFLFEAFSKGIVKMKAGNSYTAILNYSMVDEEMVFEQNGKYMVLDQPREIDTVIVQKRLFVPVENAFYEVVSKGRVPIYIQHKAKYVEEAKTTAYGMKTHTLASVNVTGIKQGNQFRTLDMPEDTKVSAAPVNWVMKDGALHKFSNASQFVKQFPGKEAELKQFIKTNRIDMKLREDLIKLGIYCNEIIK